MLHKRFANGWKNVTGNKSTSPTGSGGAVAKATRSVVSRIFSSKIWKEQRLPSKLATPRDKIL
ncbi:hypothetical protein AAC978_06255 [Desulfitobacterium sp. THU1]|uniref:hypothetical protein n=1 Tax=Desulfitobacterium sp. THU1 TaxID=3138072 RepID=UPI00311F6C80